MGNLKKLYQNSSEITKNLQDVQQKVLTDRLRWMDAETAMATQEQTMDNTIVDGFRTVNKRYRNTRSLIGVLPYPISMQNDQSRNWAVCR